RSAVVIRSVFQFGICHSSLEVQRGVQIEAELDTGEQGVDTARPEFPAAGIGGPASGCLGQNSRGETGSEVREAFASRPVHGLLCGFAAQPRQHRLAEFDPPAVATLADQRTEELTDLRVLVQEQCAETALALRVVQYRQQALDLVDAFTLERSIEER